MAKEAGVMTNETDGMAKEADGMGKQAMERQQVEGKERALPEERRPRVVVESTEVARDDDRRHVMDAAWPGQQTGYHVAFQRQKDVGAGVAFGLMLVGTVVLLRRLFTRQKAPGNLKQV